MGRRESERARARKAFNALLDRFQDGSAMRDLALVSDYIDIYHGYGSMTGRALPEEEIKVAQRLLRMGEGFVSTREWNRFRIWFIAKLLAYFVIGTYIDDQYVAHASWINWYVEDAIFGGMFAFFGHGLETLASMGIVELRIWLMKRKCE